MAVEAFPREDAAEVLAECEVLPGPGFTWDPKTGSMRAAIPAREIALVEPLSDHELASPLVQRVLAIAKRGKSNAT